jgi:hypothetical protein
MLIRRPISQSTINIYQTRVQILSDVSKVNSAKIYQRNTCMHSIQCGVHLHPWLSLPPFHKDVLQYSLPMISLCVSQDFISVRRGELLGVDIKTDYFGLFCSPNHIKTCLYSYKISVNLVN